MHARGHLGRGRTQPSSSSALTSALCRLFDSGVRSGAGAGSAALPDRAQRCPRQGAYSNHLKPGTRSWAQPPVRVFSIRHSQGLPPTVSSRCGDPSSPSLSHPYACSGAEAWGSSTVPGTVWLRAKWLSSACSSFGLRPAREHRRPLVESHRDRPAGSRHALGGDRWLAQTAPRRVSRGAGGAQAIAAC